MSGRSLFFQPISSRFNERYCGSEAELRAALVDIATAPASPRSVVIVDTIALQSPLLLNEKHLGLSLRFVGLAAKLVPSAGYSVPSAISFKPVAPIDPSLPNGICIYNLQVRGTGGTGSFTNVFDINSNAPSIAVYGGQTSLPDTSSNYWVLNGYQMLITNVIHSGGRIQLYQNNIMTACDFRGTDMYLGGGAILLGGGNVVTAVAARNVTGSTNTSGNQISNCRVTSNIDTSPGNHNIITGTFYAGTLTTAASDVTAGNMNF